MQPGACLAFNLGTGHGYSVREIIEACRRVTGRAIPTEEVERRPGDPAALYADNSKIRARAWLVSGATRTSSDRGDGLAAGTLASGACRPSGLLPPTEAVDERIPPASPEAGTPTMRWSAPRQQLPARYHGCTMVGRAMRLVLYLGWPCALAVVIGMAGVRLGQDGLAAGRRISTTMYAKYEALSVCVQSVTGEQHEAELGRDQVAASLEGLSVPQVGLFTIPAAVDVGCPRDPGPLRRERQIAPRCP